MSPQTGCDAGRRRGLFCSIAHRPSLRLITGSRLTGNLPQAASPLTHLAKAKITLETPGDDPTASLCLTFKRLRGRRNRKVEQRPRGAPSRTVRI